VVESTLRSAAKRHPEFSLGAAWIAYCALCNAAGWVLSALHQLNLGGYLATFLAVSIAVIVWWRRAGVRLGSVRVGRLRTRFRRRLPFAFLLFAGLAILSGLLYAPNNYDALAYRVPRMLHWLAEEHWQWIQTLFQRLNTRGCGMEWASMPLLVFTGTDRWFFLPNAISLVMLPGVLFSVFGRLGVRRRVAWVWMWVLPTGYCYLLQAGGIGNDLFGTLFPLLGLHFALRAVERESIGDAGLALLAAALTTSAKLSNIPLVLPVMVALLPAWRVFVRRPIAAILIAVLTVLSSAVPTAWLNSRYSEDWSGAKAEEVGGMHSDRVLRVANNSVLLVLQNFAPPVFPAAGAWNRAVKEHMPAALHDRLARGFEAGGAEWSLSELQWEVNAGMGLGLSLLLLAGFVAGWKGRRQHPPPPHRTPHRLWVLGGMVVAFLAYLAGMGMSGVGRVAAPYYPVILCVALLPACHAAVIRRRWWRGLVFCVLLLALAILCINPPRPLWPAETVLGRMAKQGQPSRTVSLAAETYAVNRARSDALGPLREAIPAGVKTIGLVTFDDPETSLWRPFGSRTIEHVTPADSAETLRTRGVEYVVVNSFIFNQRFGMTFDGWLARINGTFIKTIPLTLKASIGSQDWHIVAIKPDVTAHERE